jgi:arylsulfatase A-like enzyme
LLLVTIESFRADHVGSYGYARNTTPNFDRLARQGARFEQVIAPAPFTLPSLASVMTGLTPPAHGVRNHPATLRPEVETLAERLAGAGYRTAAMTRHSWLRRKSGFDRGFSEYHNNKFSTGLDARGLSLAAIDWLSAHRQRPFFLWLHFLDPHLPYAPAFPYSGLYHPGLQSESKVKHLRSMIDLRRENFEPTPYADLEGGPYLDPVLRYYPENPIVLDLALWRRSRGEIFFGLTRYPDKAVAEMADLYDGALVYTDDNLGRLLAAVDELGLRENTAIVVTGDHGEALGEHELFFTHDFTLYDEVLRVPLALRLPGRIPPGTVVPQQVRLIDLLPTLLDLFELPPVATAEGVSLAPLLSGRSLPFLPAFAESAPYRPLFPEQRRIYYEGNRGKWRMVRTERWKLILIPNPKGDIFELYDLVSDPGEKKNLHASLPGEAAKLWPLLKDWLDQDPERNALASEAEQKALEELDPAALQQLEALGYIQGGVKGSTRKR